ncbi:ATP-binding cassette domain-containing protein [Entomospira entomophila]|uniref:ATP-binding cassette domain-containing protein n=1 Tax=Entomospira entomophila TaxID=2719988 RepID=A0A968GCG0_9SPIO|nr:ATP-binding cassette domain-containing protein [Entomospira entomophilus]NIZ40871.1 ATP-binding cassette domain-containing protein [Entomospira entomophilus]WDI35084.1 ATP-binding cassette domain-containing protein [Entomospira entomophilus]
MSDNIVLRLHSVGFEYEENVIVENISFEQQRGEAIAFIGLSGSGKTTLLKLIAGILTPTKGHIERNIENVAYVSQYESLLPWLSIFENLLIRERLHDGYYSEVIKEKALKILEEVGLSGYENHYPYQLSGGMKKRVELARALLHNPDLLLLDEPFTALDPFHREKLYELTKRLCKENSTTLILVTHTLDEVYYLADIILGIAGKPATVAIMSRVESHFSQTEVRDFLRSKVGSYDTLYQFFHTKIEEEELITDINLLRPKRNWSYLKEYFLPFMLMILLVTGGLSMAKYLFQWPDYLFPYPPQVVNNLWGMIRSGVAFEHFFITIQSAFLGFLLASSIAIPLGYMFSQNKQVKRYGLPLVLIANTIPTIAIAPFIVLWFGYGLFARVLTVLSIVWLPLVIGSYQAFTYSHGFIQEYIDFYQPKWWKRWLFLELPASVSGIIASIKVSITLSVVGAVVAEFIAGSKGLGALLNIAKAQYNTAMMFAVLILLMISGLMLYSVSVLIEKWLMHRHFGYLKIMRK